MQKIDYVIYHANCSDGISSAWIVTSLSQPGKQAIKIPCIAGKEPECDLETFRDKSVLFVDICPRPEYLAKMMPISSNIVIIDHHDNAVGDIVLFLALNNSRIIMHNHPTDLQVVSFCYDGGSGSGDDNGDTHTHKAVTVIQSDMHVKSGCILTWEYFFPDAKEEIPWFLKYIADRDTWAWKLPHSREINACLFEDRHITFDGLERLYDNNDGVESLTMEEAHKRGAEILEIRNKMNDRFMKTAVACKYQDKYYVWLYTALPEYKSDVGNALLKKDISIASSSTTDAGEEKVTVSPDFTVCWYYNFPTDEYWLSLRSDDTKPDVCAIAKELAPENGGGHRNASGCSLSRSDVALKDLFVVI